MAQNLTTARTVRGILLPFTLSSEIDLGENSHLLYGDPNSAGESREDGLIPAASREFEDVCGRAIDFLQNQTVRIDGNGTYQLMIPAEYLPVASITSITVNGGGVDMNWVKQDLRNGLLTFSYGEAPQPYLADLASNWNSRFDRRKWFKGVANVSLVMSYGYANAAGTAFQTPAQVALAVGRYVAMQALLMDAGTDARGGGIQSLRIDYLSETYGERWKQQFVAWTRNFYEVAHRFQIAF